MTTDIATVPAPQTGVLYSVTEETIAARKAELLAIKINGVEDEKGLALARAAKRDVVKWRTSVEATRKELKEPHLKAGREIDSEAAKLTNLIVPIESHLTQQIDAIEDEQAKIAERKQQELLEHRQERLKAAGGDLRSINPGSLLSLSEPAFAILVENTQKATDERIAEQKRKEAEEVERKRLADEEAERNKLERERLAKEREDFEAKQREAEEKRAAEQREILKQQEEIAEKRRQVERDEAQVKATARAAMLNSRRFRLQGLADPSDDELAAFSDDEFDAYLLRIAAEEEAYQERLSSRRSRIAPYEVQKSDEDLMGYDDPQFEEFLEDCRQTYTKMKEHLAGMIEAEPLSMPPMAYGLVPESAYAADLEEIQTEVSKDDLKDYLMGETTLADIKQLLEKIRDNQKTTRVRFSVAFVLGAWEFELQSGGYSKCDPSLHEVLSAAEKLASGPVIAGDK